MSTVLVVDDTAVDRKLAGRLLEKAPGIQVLYADGGQAALELLQSECVDLIVTDLQMPDMDGLQLLTAIQEHSSEIPVVLMTAHGSEDIASLALEHGAVSFVPKAHLADLLADTVLQILARCGTEQKYDRLIRCAQRTEFEFRLENDVALIEPLVELLQEIAVSMQVVSGSRSAKMGVALEHALHNAMFRGNLEIPRGSSGAPDMALLRERLADPRYRERRVLVWAKVTPTEAQIVITDEGPGFDAAKFLSSATPEALAEAGRGLVLMKSFFGNLQFNERGNQVTLIQRVSTH